MENREGVVQTVEIQNLQSINGVLQNIEMIHVNTGGILQTI